jgi:copper(I)-binding protein
VRTRLGVGIAVCLALLASGCAAGKNAATSEVQAAIDGTQVDVGSIQLRAVAIPAPANGNSYAFGTDVPLELVVVNSGKDTDTLTSINSPNFSSPTQASVDVSSQQAVQIGIGSAAHLTLTGLNSAPGGASALFPGQTIPVTFTFRTAGSVTTKVPVQLTGTANTAQVPAPSGAGE